MRKLLRSKARFTMRSAGYVRLNKSRYAPNGGKLPSLFAQRWREFC